MDRQALSRLFRKFLPVSSVIDQAELLRAYECDGLSAYRQLPLLVVLPETAEQVRRVMLICAQHRVPIVYRGAGTSLSGGALPHAEGIVLSLAKMKAILEIDPHNRVARVQPGVRNLVISESVKHLGLFYAPDPSSQIACTIGGNVAENAGGVHCLKYGVTVHNVLSVDVITIDGERLTLGGAALDSPGFDLRALVVGSEGMLGAVVEVTVKLVPHPEDVKVILGAFLSIEECANSVAAIIAAGIIPAGMEMMDNTTIRAVEKFVQAGYPTDAKAVLLCEIDGHTTEVKEQVSEVTQILTRYGAIETRIARDEHECALFWSGRKNAFPAIGKISPDYYCIDGTIPRKHLAPVLSEINRLSDEYGLRVANVFHAGDGNLHPLILYDSTVPGELKKTEQLGSDILRLCITFGGTITGEHGVGIEKIDEMCVQFNEAELTQFQAVRNVFDPQQLLNPGKAIPTLARCAEYNAMHVHHGELPFPELDRF